MEKVGNADDESRKMLVNEIYEKFRSHKFIDRIGTDVLTEVKQTVAYKQIRDIITHQFLNMASDSSNGGVVELKKKQIESATIGYFAEIICSDLNKVLRSKLHTTYRPLFVNKIKNLIKCKAVGQTNAKVPGNTRLHSLKKPTEVKQKTTVKQKSKNQEDLKSKRKKQIFENLGNISRGCAENLQGIESHMMKIDTKGKYVKPSERSSNHASNSSKANEFHEDSTKSASSTYTSRCERLLNNEFFNYIENPEIKQEPDSEDSELSFTIFSDDSVSSVHTSDLSSFDDIISISSEDEGGNKRRKSISFREAKERYLDSGLVASGQDKKQKIHDKEESYSLQVQKV